MKKQIPAIFCDIDGVTTQKFYTPKWDSFGTANTDMVAVLRTLATQFRIVFITGRWAVGGDRVTKMVQKLLSNTDNIDVFCKPQDFPGTTAEYKLSIIKELESRGYKFYIGFDDNMAVAGLLHNHGIFMGYIVSD